MAAIVDKIVRWNCGGCEEAADALAEEEPLEIRVRGRALSVTMRTPGNDDELAAGFLLSENVVRRREDIAEFQVCDRNEDGNLLNVQLAAEVRVDFERLTRHVFASSSCGLCGKATIEAVRRQFAVLPPGERPLIDAKTLTGLPGVMRALQATFDRTGGLHAAALFDGNGSLLVLREDIGRHNAVDKVIGWGLLNDRVPLSGQILLVSGRTSFELVQKSLAAGVPILAAVSAPSSLAVRFAEENGQTLIGFLRDQRMNIYTHARRVHLG